MGPSAPVLAFLLVALACSLSNALQVSRSTSWQPTAGKLSTQQVFRIIDTNKDGRISVQELIDAAAFHWNDLDTSNRARITFNLAHPTDFVSAYDRDGYLVTAEHMCCLNHCNIIEQCILNSPCSSLCDCVAEAEKAAHGKAKLVLQYPDGSQEFSSSSLLIPNSTAVGHPQKRFFFLFLGLLLAAILNIAITAALISISEVQQQTGQQVGFMDFDVWDSDSSNPPPSCSVYVFWSTSCGPILSGKARGCSNGGTRLYKNSCKDAFRYGSRGCGFLDLGCRSLCYAVNDEGCPCSYFDDWKEQDNIDYPGNDLETLHVDKLSDCRNACASSPQCLAFVTPPPDGTDNQMNCFLKGALGSFKQATGSISFIKILSNENTCPSSLNTLVGDDNNSGVFNRRGVSIPRNTLIPRIGDDGINGKAFPFDPSDPRFLVIAQFLQALYQTLWINREQVQRTSEHLMLTAIGAGDLMPLPDEQVASAANPRWRVANGWRVINAFRNLMNLGTTTNTPIASYINAQPTSTNDDLNRAVMPTALRSLFIANELIINVGTEPWAGNGAGRATGYPGIQAVHGGGSSLGYYQGRSIGPMPLEGAFIMASQLAGINWAQTAQRLVAIRRHTFWLNGIVPRVQGDPGIPQCLRQYAEGHEFDPSPSRLRRIGFLSRDGDATGGPREGFYFIVDVDGQADVETNPDRNIFVFVVHAINPHSRINVPNVNALRNLQYTTFDPNANPDARPDGPTGQRQQRFFAHAHAGLLRWSQIRDFMNQDPTSSTRVGFPGYVQIGSFHIYINNENESNIHPRLSYLNNDNGGRKHDEL